MPKDLEKIDKEVLNAVNDSPFKVGTSETESPFNVQGGEQDASSELSKEE